jgi:hypothetical protein
MLPTSLIIEFNCSKIFSMGTETSRKWILIGVTLI